MTNTDPLAGMSAMLIAQTGVFILTGLLPFVVFFLLDGIVALLRGRGLVPIFVAVGLVASTAVLGAVFRQWGIDQLDGSPAYEASMMGLDSNARLFLSFCVPLGAIAFVVRMVRMLFSRK